MPQLTIIAGSTPVKQIMKLMERHPVCAAKLLADYFRVRLTESLSRVKS
jgi:hypothetical protein